VATLLVVVGAWYYVIGIVDDIETEPVDQTTNNLRTGENAIFVPDQNLGNNVILGFVDIVNGGYVVIHEMVNGEPGTIIGASALLSRGVSGGISVALSRESTEGEEFIAMLYNDNGDGVFNAADDMPVFEKGSTVFMYFGVSRNTKTSNAAGSPGV